MASPAPRILTRPTPGLYLLALVRGGWKTPCMIFTVGQNYTGVVNGEPLRRTWTEEDLEAEAAEFTAQGELFNHPLLRIVLFGELTDEATYRYRLAMKDWARLHRPNHPCLRPAVPMDPNTLEATDF